MVSMFSCAFVMFVPLTLGTKENPGKPFAKCLGNGLLEGCGLLPGTIGPFAAIRRGALIHKPFKANGCDKNEEGDSSTWHR